MKKSMFFTLLVLYSTSILSQTNYVSELGCSWVGTDCVQNWGSCNCEVETLNANTLNCACNDPDDGDNPSGDSPSGDDGSNDDPPSGSGNNNGGGEPNYVSELGCSWIGNSCTRNWGSCKCEIEALGANTLNCACNDPEGEDEDNPSGDSPSGDDGSNDDPPSGSGNNNGDGEPNYVSELGCSWIAGNSCTRNWGSCKCEIEALGANTLNCACNDPNGSGGASGKTEDKVKSNAININKLTLKASFNQSNKVSLFLEIPESNTLEITIYDLMGTQILQQSDYVIKGKHQREVVLPKNMASKVYFISATIGEERIVKKFIRP